MYFCTPHQAKKLKVYPTNLIILTLIYLLPTLLSTATASRLELSATGTRLGVFWKQSGIRGAPGEGDVVDIGGGVIRTLSRLQLINKRAYGFYTFIVSQTLT